MAQNDGLKIIRAMIPGFKIKLWIPDIMTLGLKILACAEQHLMASAVDFMFYQWCNITDRKSQFAKEPIMVMISFSYSIHVCNFFLQSCM